MEETYIKKDDSTLQISSQRTENFTINEIENQIALLELDITLWKKRKEEAIKLGIKNK
jgi:hypothetical protein